jgi:transcriptional regulator with XRE-family HTH domain
MANIKARAAVYSPAGVGRGDGARVQVATMTRGRKAKPAKGLGRRWRELRESRAWSLDDAAAATGIAPQTLSAIELGEKVPGGQTVLMASKVYGVPTDELLDENAFPLPAILDRMDRAGTFTPKLTEDEKRKLSRLRLVLGHDPDEGDFLVVVATLRRK